MVGFCSGTIAGLVAATPASGFIEPWAALVMGILTGTLCNLATKGASYDLMIFCKILIHLFQ